MLSRLFFVVVLVIVGVWSRALESDGSEKSMAPENAHQSKRVQIKVFRGPTEQDGKETYAPWGYWVKQPADDYQ